MFLKYKFQLTVWAIALIFIYALTACSNSGDSDNGTGNKIKDTTPEAFSFTQQTDVALNAVVVSNAIAVTGINEATAISVVDGEYSINSGVYTNASGTVNSNDSIVLRITSAGNPATTRNAVLTIGGISATFSVTTLAADTTPDSFSFVDQTNVTLNTVATSNIITVTGIDSASVISIEGGEYAINNGTYSSETGTVSNGDNVVLHLTSSSDPTTTTNATLTIGGISDTFSVTTTTQVPPTPTETVLLSWDIPQLRADGSTGLALEEIGGYRIYMSTNNGAFIALADINVQQSPTYTSPPLIAGNYKFAVTTYDSNGDESAHSNYIEANIP